MGLLVNIWDDVDVEVLLKIFSLLYSQNHSKYLPHIWYGPSLELLLYATMLLDLVPGFGQSSIARMMLMFRNFEVYFNSFKACTAKVFQGTCFGFGQNLPLSIGFSFVQPCF